MTTGRQADEPMAYEGYEGGFCNFPLYKSLVFILHKWSATATGSMAFRLLLELRATQEQCDLNPSNYGTYRKKLFNPHKIILRKFANPHNF